MASIKTYCPDSAPRAHHRRRLVSGLFYTMRQTLFRGKDAVTGEWRIGYYTKTDSRYDGFVDTIVVDYGDALVPFPIIRDTLGLSTGLKIGDKEVFEGDKLRCSKQERHTDGIVTFEHGHFWWRFGDDKDNNLSKAAFLGEVISYLQPAIIGNIHDNNNTEEI